MKIAIDPPLPQSEADRLNSVLPHGLPEGLRDFYTTASAHAVFSYYWEPDRIDYDELADVLPHEYSFGGGHQLCPAAELEKEQRNLYGMADIYRDVGGPSVEAARVMSESVPLFLLGNGDSIVLHVAASKNAMQVIYASYSYDHQESPLIPLSATFDEFMEHWERLGYLGPEIWLLFPFLDDSASRRLDGSSPLAKKWRSLVDRMKTRNA